MHTRLETLLEIHGYTVRITDAQPHLCVLQRAGERWLGLGDGPADALQDAVRQALPSHLGQALLATHLASPAAFDAAPAEVDWAELTPDTGGRSGPTVGPDEIAPDEIAPDEIAPADRGEAQLLEVSLAAGTERPEPGAEVATQPGEAQRVSPQVPDAPTDHVAAVGEGELPDLDTPGGVSELPADPVSGPEIAPLPPTRDAGAAAAPTPTPASEAQPTHFGEALEQLALLRETISASFRELATCAAPIQRLQLTAWVARARAIEDQFADDAGVERDVRRLVQRISDLAKRWWSGTVDALFLDATPEKVGALLPVPVQVRTWWQVEEAVDALLADDPPCAANGEPLDWCDGRCLKPAALNAESQLGQARQVIEGLLGPVGGLPPRWSASAFNLNGPGYEELARAASRLRWIREDVVDQRLWVHLFGRLRWLAWHDRRAPEALAQALDHRWRPDGSWASWLGHDPEERVRRRRLRAALHAFDALGTAPTPGALAAWLVEAFDIRAKSLHGKSLAALLHPHADAVASLDIAQLPESDRRIRRRLRGLQRDLTALGADEAIEHADKVRAEVAAADDEPDEPPSAAESLAARLRPKLEGQRALFVSNRSDQEIATELERMLGLQVEMIVHKPGRVRNACQAIGQARYQVVLAATGFIGHQTELPLLAACRLAGVPYVRAYKGRPLACMRALARDLK